jgi:hypothetical protein
MASRDTDILHLHPEFRRRIVRVLGRLEDEGIPFRLFEGFRGAARQGELFAQGRTKPGAKVTNARPWQSYHQFGCSADLVLYVDGNWSWDDKGPRAAWWKRLQIIGREEGLEPLSWELPHLQLKGLTVAGLRAGKYPKDGDSPWAENLAAAIRKYPSGAPPVPKIAPERPPLAPDAPEPARLPEDEPEPAAESRPPASDSADAPTAGEVVPAVAAATPTPVAKVTAGSGSWVRAVLAWMGSVFTVASGHVERVFGMTPEIQRIVLYALIVAGVVWLVLKAVAEWQIRRIAATPGLRDVK